ncbi:hypothetical protein CROQUDRAFT_690422 [Cronartium quercuum f. sp. fusiforme G11]|uniref:Uncharacterized protein n=1 Tax=Cronartium quercuum f. sp. fusiforme G11 TaxID=708437 RepID=A0A9P6NA17_9BASI|nr:hypothetical protein CROQUDRAFT_690422 [Cronartium quercuum f. sp. fusiforme G11]
MHLFIFFCTCFFLHPLLALDATVMEGVTEMGRAVSGEEKLEEAHNAASLGPSAHNSPDHPLDAPPFRENDHEPGISKNEPSEQKKAQSGLDSVKIASKDEKKKSDEKKLSIFVRAWRALKRSVKKFWKWLSSDTTNYQYWLERRKKSPPDTETGPWRLNNWYRHNPRPANDDADKDLQNLRVLGNELREDYDRRKAIWIEKDLPRHHNTKLHIEILSDDDFLHLVMRYTAQYDQAKVNQKQVLRLWNDLVRDWGSEYNVRDLLTRIEDYYLKIFPDWQRDKFGINFYKLMHNPLLLPTTEESKHLDWEKIFEQENIAFGRNEKTHQLKSARLLEQCKEYRKYVDLWRDAMDSGAAIKKYLTTLRELTFEESRYPAQVLEKFKNLFFKRDGAFIQRSIKELEDYLRSQFGHIA